MPGGGNREWFSVAELAELALPGLPGTKRGLQNLANAEGWGLARCDVRGALARPRAGRGGGTEYHFSLLPAAAQGRLMATPTEKAPPTLAARDSAWARFDRLPTTQKDVARRRLELLAKVETIVANGMGKAKAVELLAAQAAREAQLSGRAPEFTASTLYNWFRLVAGVDAGDRLAYLAPDYVGRTDTAECHPEAWRIFKSDYLRPRRSFAAAYDTAQAQAREQGWAVPSLKTLQRRLMREVSRPIQVLMREGEDALRRELPWIERDETTFHALEAVNVDGHKWDVMVDFGDGKPTRPMMIAIQDVYSRKMLGWRIARSENADAVRMCFADVFRTWGIPRLCFFDNGRAFASKWLTGGAPNRFRFAVKAHDPVGLLTQFGVEVHFTTPYSGQSKPIERSFGDLEGRIGTSAAFQGAYVGNNPLAKPHTAGQRAIPLAEFEAIVAAGIASHNAREGRRTKAAGGRSFDAAFAESFERSLIQRATAEQLRQALLCAEAVTVRQNGHGIILANNRYWADFMLDLVGQKVAVHFDADDLHAGVSIYSLSGQYLGDAECLDKVGFANAEEGRERQRLKKALEKSIKQRAAVERDLDAHDLARLGPEFTEEEISRPRVVAPFFGSAAPRIDEDEEAMEAAIQNFNRAASHLRVVGEDE